MSDLDAKQLENAHAFFKHLNARDWDALGDLLASDFKHQWFPATFVAPDGKEMRSKEEFIGFMQYSFTPGHVFERLHLEEPLDVVHGSNKVAFHLKSNGMSKSGKQYSNEYMITLHFDGEKIIKTNEFIDSKYTDEFFTALRAESSS
ncbi:hypothetical protein B0H16DRAFT_1588895 [Mycena metata]|uniref:SnoaL-like domain-containing protein n=1 Tax=Mycena metata TaxID=1033252 RepID=A0AAD7HVW8_9AGAR|nr:hypothetical protein B0H16DRAFT_1588895 [Mycena metata]